MTEKRPDNWHLLIEPISRRQYLTMKLQGDGVSWMLAQEAISSTAMEHPEWDMDEKKTFDEWEKYRGEEG